MKIFFAIALSVSIPAFAADKATTASEGLKEHEAIDADCAQRAEEIKKLYAKEKLNGNVIIRGDENLKKAMELATGANLGSPKIAAAQLALSEEKAPSKQEVIDLVKLNGEPLRCYSLYNDPIRSTIRGLGESSNKSLKKEAIAQLKEWSTSEASITAIGFMLRTAVLKTAIEAKLLNASAEELAQLEKIRADMKNDIAPHTFKLNEAIRAATLDKNKKDARPELTAKSNFDPVQLRDLFGQEKLMVRKHNDVLKPWVARITAKSP